MYEIRLCKSEELPLLRQFLKSSWSEEHIFLRNKEILDFQHQTCDGYNFVVAYHAVTNCFHGALGIISPEFYLDRKIGEKQNIWLAIWKVDKELAQSNSLGLDMLEYVDATFSPESISAIGINHNVALVYRLLGFRIKTMNQWFLPNREIVNPQLLRGALPNNTHQSPHQLDMKLEHGIEREDEIRSFLTKVNANRSFRYIVERYVRHPFYKYSVYAFKHEDDSIYAIAIGREVSGEGGHAFRLTELFYESEHYKGVGSALNKLVVHRGYEYVDFLEYGFDKKAMEDIGFIKCTDQCFVPHLFEPFIAEHKKVQIAFRSASSFSCTKGDSDLDRPNLG